MPPQDKLERYQSMRDFGATPEPSGDEPGGPGVSPENAVAPHPEGLPRFVIQEHHATSLHWDLRFERDGVLPSWAIPRGLPPHPSQNHLAVHTEDHPLLYLDFSGDIPSGQYGAGQMTIWDSGTYETEKWSEKEVMVVLHGQRAQGRYVLFRTGQSKSGQEQWMIHRMDPPDDPGREPVPERLSPMLATPAKVLPPDEESWAFEVKWDGIRSLVTVSGGRVRIEARSGNDVTARYPELRELGRSMGTTQAVLDGEIVAFDPATGRPSFERLQRRMHVTSESAIRRLRSDVPVVLAIFDLLWLEGHSLMGLPYVERRRALEALGLKGPAWQVPAAYEGDGTMLMEAVRAQGLEGVVAKRLDSVYEPGARSRGWLKIKNLLSQELVVGGWLPGEGSRGARLGALLLGVHDDEGRLNFAGRVGTGFTDKELDRLMALLTARQRDDPPFDPMPPRGTIPLREAHWVEPDLVVEVAFTEWTNVGILRQPSYKGLRDDKRATEVVRET